MARTLQDRIGALIHQVLDSYPGAWVVWCDPRGDWLPLLQQVALGPIGFSLHQEATELAGQLGGLRSRAELQARIAVGEPFVLCVPRPADQLGWVWAQARLAERIYDRPLREQLRNWGWRPHRLTMSDEEVAALARRSLHTDPAEWGGAGLRPDKALLLEVLAGGAQFVQTKMLSTKSPASKTKGAKDEGALASMNKSMLYFMPFITIIIGTRLPGGLTLYWLLTTVLTVVQQKFLFARMKTSPAIIEGEIKQVPKK